MNKQEKIKAMYFNEKHKQKEIAEKLNVSNQYVSKTLLKDNRYKAEKEQQTILKIKEKSKAMTQNMNI